MPIYAYRCNNCDYTFEQYQRMSDAPLSDCPVCEGGVRRLINQVGVVFKGSGFYVTDSRNGRSLNGKSDKGQSGEAKGETAGGKSTSKSNSAEKPKVAEKTAK